MILAIRVTRNARKITIPIGSGTDTLRNVIGTTKKDKHDKHTAMAEKTFREIEVEIQKKGFAQLCGEAAEEIQNITRGLGYLGDCYPELKKVIDETTGLLVKAGVELLELSKGVE